MYFMGGAKVVDEGKLIFRSMMALFGALGRFPRTRFSGEFPGLALFDSGVGSSYENYAMLSPRAAPSALADAVEFGLDFFARTGRSHVWPIFEWIPDDICAILERAGLRRDEDFYAMAADVRLDSGCGAPSGVVADASVREGCAVREWASCAWFGFESGEPFPEEYVEYAQNMASLGEISLIAARLAASGEAPPGEIAATGMSFVSEGIWGIYNISTLPKYRRRGLAMAVVREAMRLSRSSGAERAALLATPEGRPLYLRCGFADEGAVKIFVR
ncbi:MAG: GNAT family N-acetyltransferase [Synergistaceae bacterium]|nr:GNAT family N-acetyltransferase [Synergistaceae bacterium]